MEKEQQDLAWACLPKEMRLGIVQLYVEFQAESKGDYINRPFWVSIIRKFESIFREHNLTSDTEPEELVHIKRSTLIDRYASYSKESDNIKNNEPYLQFCEGRLNALANLFGDKCLPDKEPSVQVEPRFHKGQIVIYEGRLYEVEGKTGKHHYALKGTCYEVHEDYLEPYTEPETKDNTQQNSWDEDFKKMNECFEKIHKTLS